MTDVDASMQLDGGSAADGEPTVADGTSKRRGRSRRVWDAAAVTGMLAMAFLVTSSLWADPSGRMLWGNPRDQALFEWMLGHGARVVAHGENPFASTRMGYPDGLNVMANASILGLSIPLSPVTLLLGTSVGFAVLLTFGFAVTGTSWYFLFSRHLTDSVPVAVLGAAFAAFAPGVVAHGNGNLNLVWLFLVPWIVWYTLRLRDHPIRNGVILGLLVTWQAFINEEVLLFTTVGAGLYVGILALVRREPRANAVPFVKGLGVAVLVALALLAYPLWGQFYGPHAYTQIGVDPAWLSNDVLTFVHFSYDSLGGWLFGKSRYALLPGEQNTFFGLALVVLVAGLVWWLRRDSRVLAAAGVGLVFAIASLGPSVRIQGHRVGPGPWVAATYLPVLEKVIPTHLSLVVAPVIAVLLVLAGNQVRAIAADTPVRFASALRLLWVTVLAVALLPLLPTPLRTIDRLPVPAFFTTGTWTSYVGANQSIVFTPPASGLDTQAVMWAAAADPAVTIANGYYLFPDPATGVSDYNPPPRCYGSILYTVSLTGKIPVITEQDRRLAIDDLRYWRAAVVVQLPARYPDAIRTTTTQLLGFEPTLVDGAWIWDVRSLADADR